MTPRIATYSPRTSQFTSWGHGRDEGYARRGLLVFRDFYLNAGGPFPDNPNHDKTICNCPECTAHGSQKSHWGRAVYYKLVYGLCLVAAVASLVVLISESSPLRSLRSILGAVRVVVLLVFSVKLACQGSWETAHGVILNAIACWVVCPAVLLNIPGPGPQNMDTIYQAAVSVLALGWIALRFGGGDRAQAEGTNRGDTSIRSGGHWYADAREANHHEDVSDTFDSFRDVEMAVFNRAAD